MATLQQQTDVVVIGSGPAGYPCAIRLAQLGKKVTVIEKGDIGGVCLNVGCIPSKALIYAGTTFDKMDHVSEMGISVSSPKLQLPKLIEWKASVVKKLTGGVSQLLKANGCTVIAGEAKFTGPKTLEVKTKADTIQLSFGSCVIATGSRPSKLPGFEIDQKQIIDSTGALSLTEQPKSMLCIGGGYIGLELGTFYSKIGTEVTVVEGMPNLLGMVDPALTNVVQKRLEKRGVKLLLGTSVKGCKTSKKGVEVTFAQNGAQGSKTFSETYDTVLVTIGRTPNSEGLGLDKAGVKLDAKGFILVDAQRRTNVPNIYAIGDIAGQPLLAHKGTKEGLVAAEVIAGKKTVYDVIAMPAVIFTDPEIATVGLTEAEAKAKGLNISVGIFPFAANGRRCEDGKTSRSSYRRCGSFEFDF
jgi:dihydrolipoamide dehydrogenase